jgi:transposase
LGPNWVIPTAIYGVFWPITRHMWGSLPANCVSPTKTQDGRSLRRYKRRWKVERLNSWLLSYRRIAVRYEYKVENYIGFVHLACIRILLRHHF